MTATTKIAKLMNAALAAATVYADGSSAATVYEQDVLGRAEHRGYDAMKSALVACGFVDSGDVWMKVSADRTKQAVIRLHDPSGRKGKGWICCVEIAPAGLTF